jgi:hypothetical protein
MDPLQTESSVISPIDRSYDGRLTSTTISLLGHDLLLFADRETVIKLSKQPTVSSPSFIYTFTLRYLFGMPERILELYSRDDSAPSSQNSQNRRRDPTSIRQQLHRGFSRSWSGPGLIPTTRRYFDSLRASLDDKGLTSQYTEIQDLSDLLSEIVSTSLIKSFFGPMLLDLNPDFIQDLRKFDDIIPSLAKGLPPSLVPGGRIRDVVRGHFELWYKSARQEFTGTCIDEDGDGDPFWGSESTRSRHKILMDSGHDDSCLSSADLCLAWA